MTWPMRRRASAAAAPCAEVLAMLYDSSRENLDMSSSNVPTLKQSGEYGRGAGEELKLGVMRAPTGGSFGSGCTSQMTVGWIACKALDCRSISATGTGWMVWSLKATNTGRECVKAMEVACRILETMGPLVSKRR